MREGGRERGREREGEREGDRESVCLHLRSKLCVIFSCLLDVCGATDGVSAARRLADEGRDGDGGDSVHLEEVTHTESTQYRSVVSKVQV